ncbi:MAG: DegV family protein, partial [Clostridia bacterium]|nr:DegV family protein [Clostridia bacterium]
MATVKIVTDSTADLPAALRSAYDITVMPLKVIFKDEIYREGVDITIPAFFEKLAGTEQLPTTSQPSPAEFQEVYEELTADGSTVISMHISSKMSGTIQSAMLAKKNLPDRDIRVIDSGKVTMALGLGVLVGARAAQAGRSADEVEALVQEMFNHKIKIYFMVDTFENLQKGGRIGKAAALLGTLLNIKPILTVEDGLVAPFEKVRGKTKAVERLV